MQLPKIQQSRRIMYGLPDLRGVSFLSTILHYGHPRVECMHQSFGIRHVHSMVTDQEQVDCSQKIVRTYQV